MATKASKSRSWKMERASVHRTGSTRPKTNKYSKSDANRTPKAGRGRIWVGGYTRSDGVEVQGHYRDT